MTTEHPCVGLTKAAHKAFERIAINMPPTQVSRKTIQTLIDRNLIEVRSREVGRDCLGPIRILEYYVPLPVHMQWCEWCAENVSEDLTACG